MQEEQQKILDQKMECAEEYERYKALIEQDDQIRKDRAAEENKKQEAEDEKARERVQMDDAARNIQRKWDWYQKVGRFQKKKGKKGKKGKKKK